MRGTENGTDNRRTGNGGEDYHGWSGASLGISDNPSFPPIPSAREYLVRWYKGYGTTVGPIGSHSDEHLSRHRQLGSITRICRGRSKAFSNDLAWLRTSQSSR